VEVIKEIMEIFIHQQEQHNEAMLQLMAQAMQGNGQYFGAPQVLEPSPAPTKVTSGGLLNAIMERLQQKADSLS
jgi:hypothetical protein